MNFLIIFTAMIRSLDKLLSFLAKLERFTNSGRVTSKTLQGLLSNTEKLIESVKTWIDVSRNVLALFTHEGEAVHENVSGMVVVEVDTEPVVDMDPVADTDRVVKVDPVVEAEADTDPVAEADPVAKVDPVAKAEADTDLVAKVDPVAEAEADTRGGSHCEWLDKCH
jgi:hypothetical protein